MNCRVSGRGLTISYGLSSMFGSPIQEAPDVALQPSAWFGSFEVPDFQRDPDQRLRLGFEESAKDIACGREELGNRGADCQDRLRSPNGKVIALGRGSLGGPYFARPRNGRNVRKSESSGRGTSW
jgi:hypothetical protein